MSRKSAGQVTHRSPIFEAAGSFVAAASFFPASSRRCCCSPRSGHGSSGYGDWWCLVRGAVAPPTPPHTLLTTPTIHSHDSRPVFTIPISFPDNPDIGLTFSVQQIYGAFKLLFSLESDSLEIFILYTKHCSSPSFKPVKHCNVLHF